MQLSQLDTNKMCDIFCEITEPISVILSDQNLLDVLKDKMGLKPESSKAEQLQAGAMKIGLLAPILLKDHRKEVYKILATVNEKTIEEIAEQKAMITIKEIKDFITDKDLMSFFQ